MALAVGQQTRAPRARAERIVEIVTVRLEPGVTAAFPRKMPDIGTNAVCDDAVLDMEVGYGERLAWEDGAR